MNGSFALGFCIGVALGGLFALIPIVRRVMENSRREKQFAAAVEERWHRLIGSSISKE